jgi:hypothetical protein
MLPSSRKKIEWATAVWDDYIDDEVIRKALSKVRACSPPRLLRHIPNPAIVGTDVLRIGLWVQ